MAVRGGAFALAVDHRPVAELGQAGERDVPVDSLVEHQPFALPVLGKIADAEAARRRAAVDVDRFAVEFDRARRDGQGAEDHLHQFGAACTDETGKAENFAALESEARRFDAIAGKLADRKRQHLGFDAARRRGEIADRAPDHQFDDAFRRGVGGGEFADLPAVAHDGDGVGDLGDFLQPMRDVDETGAARLELADDAE